MRKDLLLRNAANTYVQVGDTASTAPSVLNVAHVARNPLGLPSIVNTAVTWAGAILGVIHGYKRNNKSVGWAIGWGIFGHALPVFALPLMYVEGFGKPKGS